MDGIDVTQTVPNQILSISGWFLVAIETLHAFLPKFIQDKIERVLSEKLSLREDEQRSVIPTNGNSFVSSLPFPQKLIMPIILRFFGTKPPQKSIERELCNDLTSEQASKIVKDFTPESKVLYKTKITFNLPDTKRLYIKLENDKAMRGDFQDKMAKNLKAEKIITIDSGHLPMISKAKELAAILSDFVGEIGQDERTDDS
ncbi:alpha/beta fold hydrolase [Lunatibacter salilacus]|uniref:alpha/beta fold hydrolase n=1 Tax=Lunatibacter salilacus TaxID=2483804 RepID=UPI00131B3876|nr:hypothetical protein [Lunatibacter salilacus]